LEKRFVCELAIIKYPVIQVTIYSKNKNNFLKDFLHV